MVKGEPASSEDLGDAWRARWGRWAGAEAWWEPGKGIWWRGSRGRSLGSCCWDCLAPLKTKFHRHPVKPGAGTLSLAPPDDFQSFQSRGVALRG